MFCHRRKAVAIDAFAHLLHVREVLIIINCSVHTFLEGHELLSENAATQIIRVRIYRL